MKRAARRLLAAALPILQPLRRAWWRIARPKTSGVRAVVFDAGGRIVLVRHLYEPGLYLPGGGIKRDETPEAAIRRELAEEIGLVDFAELGLFGAYASAREGKRDTIHLFVIRGAVLGAADSAEIAERGLCHPAALPDDVTPATRRRIAEVLEGRGEGGGAW